MKRILALMVVTLLLIGGAGATKSPLMGDEGALSTDVTTDATGIGITIAAMNGLQTDVDAVEANDTSHDSEISSLQSNDTSHDSRLTATEANDTNLASNDTAQQGAIDALETNATTQQGAIDTVEAAYLSEMVINVPIAATSVDQYVFVADGAWTITSIKEVHTVAGNDGSAANFTITICDDGEAPDEGLAVHNSTVDLKATAKTIQEATLSGIAANVTVENNDTIAIDFRGVLTTLAGGTITIEMER